MKKVKPDMPLKEVLDMHEDVAMVLLRHGMSCFNCPNAGGKTLEIAAMGHGADLDAIVTEINQLLEQSDAPKADEAASE